MCIRDSPAVKGIVDGLVRAGVLADDSGAHVLAEVYLAPVLRSPRGDGVALWVLAP